MNSALLTINAGSSSLKFALFTLDSHGGIPQRQYRGLVANIGGRGGFTVRDADGTTVLNSAGISGNHEQALSMALEWCRETLSGNPLLGVGHRVVHGGDRYFVPQRVDEDVIADLRRYESLAPLHQVHNLNAMAAMLKLHPELPQVACFDTAFHHSQSELVASFALPKEFRKAGIRRYGFHGLSYEYLAEVMPEYLGDVAERRVVVAHLGNGASLCAMKGRKSVATTMGLTPLDGLMMGTRCGTIDPGVLLHLQQQLGMSVSQVAELLNERAGLLGVSGISPDMHVLLESNEPTAKQAIDLFVYRIVRELGSMAAALGGLDALVFTAGIGEHAAEVREAVLEQSAWLGFTVDKEANRRHGPCITTRESKTPAWVIHTDEEQVIARHTGQAIRTD